MKVNLPEGWVETEEKTSMDTFGNHTLHGSYKSLTRKSASYNVNLAPDPSIIKYPTNYIN